MKYSVIIPVYNLEKYIEDCIESIEIAASKAALAEVEILAVNDGSEDNSLKILSNLSAHYDNLTVINQKNAGPLKARVAGIKKSKGQFIFFVDGDDMVSANLFLSLEANIKADTELLVFNGCRFDKLQGDSDESIYDMATLSHTQNKWQIEPYICGKVFSADILKKAYIIPKNKHFYEDVGLIGQVYFNVKTVSYINEELYYYRSRLESTSYDMNEEKLYDMVYSIESGVRYLNSIRPSERERLHFEHYATVNLLLNNLVKMIMSNRQSVYVKKMAAYMKYRFPEYTKNIFNKDMGLRNTVYLWLISKRKFEMIYQLGRIKRRIKSILLDFGAKKIVLEYQKRASR